MLWRRTPSVHWSEADARWLTASILPQLIEKHGSQIWASSQAIVDERAVAHQIQLDLENKEDSSPELLAAQFEVNKAVVYDIIRKLNLKDVYVGPHVVLPKPRVEKLEAELNKITEPVSTLAACERLGVSLDVLDWLVRRVTDLTRLNDTLIRTDEYQSRRSLLHEKISLAETPIEIASLEPNSDILQAVLAQESTAGSYDASTGLWTPTKWVEARKKQCTDIFEKSGYISTKELTDFGERKSKFAKKMHAVEFARYVVAPSFLAGQEQLINDEVSEKGWFDLRTLILGTESAAHIDIKYPIHENFVIKPSFLTSQKDSLSEPVYSKALETAEQRSVQYVPKASDLKVDPSIPRDLATIIAEYSLPSIREHCVTVAKKILDAKAADKARVNQLKAAVYLQGLLSVGDEKLRHMLWEEWSQYVAEIGPVKSFAQAQAQYLGEFSPEEVKETADQMIDKVRMQLRAAKDPALILHLAIIVYHHNHYSPGVLKLRGRIIPAILKEFHFPISFVELKNMIRHPAQRLIDHVKSDSMHGA